VNDDHDDCPPAQRERARMDFGHVGDFALELKEARAALQQLRNVLGPSVPTGLPDGADAEWREALRIIDAVLPEEGE
jgi:hypothetical protein